MVKILLARRGRHKRPFYRIVVADSRAPRDGRFIEVLGTYDPLADASGVRLDMGRAEGWLKQGAQPTATGKPHGLRGEVRVESLSDVSGRFRVGATFWLLGEPPARVTVAEVRGEPRGGVYLRFKEWSSIDEAVAARGRYLAGGEGERPALPEGSYYHDQLRGLVAWTETGQRVGVVREVWSTGPHDVLVLDADGAERLLASVKSVVVDVDLAGGRI